MSKRLKRLLDIDLHLRRLKCNTASNLAKLLEVSNRTIRYDLQFLIDNFNAPLSYTRKRGWHYTDDTWRLPSVSLSKGEVFALILGAKMLESYAGSAFEKDLRSSIQILSERLPEQTKIELQDLADERVIFRSRSQISILNPEFWHQLTDASRKYRKVWIRYHAASTNQTSERIVSPYFLHICRSGNLYVIGFCDLRQEIRWFRVDRIEKLELLEQSFELDHNFDPYVYLEKIFHAEVGEKSYEIEIWFDSTIAPYIRTGNWQIDQKMIDHPDGSLTFTMISSGLNEIKRWVLGYGKGAKVKEPPELVELVRKEILQMGEHY